MKKLENLLEKTKVSITKNDACKFGRFTVVSLTDSKGHEAIGISRCSDSDNDNEGIGVTIARGRAERALYNKLNGRKTQHPFMG